MPKGLIMKKIRFNLDNLPAKEEGLTLALGNFDGLHRGHQRLFVEASLSASREAGVMFFASPFGKGPYLSSVADKCRYALSSRLDALYIFDNDERIYSFSGKEFIEKVLLPLGTKRVVVGEDFRYGHNREGGIELLKEYFDVEVVPLLEEKGQKISSTWIKSLLSEGKIEEANELLGHSYEIAGNVSRGYQNGMKIGYPTANIVPTFPYVLPRNGVYCGVVYVLGKAYRAMINVGTNPTVGKLSEPIIEAHILDYDEDCYDKTLYCAFLSFIREERKFSSLDELKAQLKKDEARVRDILI